MGFLFAERSIAIEPHPYEGRLVRLRARDESDAIPSYDWFNDPEVAQFIQARYPYSRATQRDYNAATPPLEFSNARFAIETLAGEYIGSCALRMASPEARCADLGITIGDKTRWNGGYGTDAMHVLCRFGFDQMNLHRIELGVFPDNPRAQRVYEKLGFQVEGRRRDSDYRYGRYRDIVIMGLLRDELIAPTA